MGRDTPPERPFTEAARVLNDRYGDGWRFEVTQRRREGEEAIVMGRLTLPETDVSKTQFGRARIRPPGERPAVGGSAAGIRFSLLTEQQGEREEAGDPEGSAFRRAEAEALARCVELL